MKVLFAALFIAAPPLQAAEAPHRVDAELEKIIDGKGVPGLVAAAVLDGKIVAAGVAGLRKLGSPERVELEDRFHLGSCTKSMTATLAAILVAEGKIDWDTNCAEVFDNVKIHDGFKGTTLKQLLSNTGGAPGDVPVDLWKQAWQARGAETEQRMRLVRGILKAPPAYEPGKGSVYSNAGFSIAGAMLERRAGKPFDVLIKERLFEPLGMKSAGFGAPATNGKVEQPYGHALRDGKLVAIDPAPSGDNPPAISPAGRVHASILDFARYANFHLGGIEDGPLDKKRIEALHQSGPASGGYAFGWGKAERGWARGTALTHNGSNTMFYAVIWVAPERNFAAVAACNSGGGSDACDAAVALLIRNFLEK